MAKSLIFMVDAPTVPAPVDAVKAVDRRQHSRAELPWMSGTMAVASKKFCEAGGAVWLDIMPVVDSAQADTTAAARTTNGASIIVDRRLCDAGDGCDELKAAFRLLAPSIY